MKFTTNNVPATVEQQQALDADTVLVKNYESLCNLMDNRTPIHVSLRISKVDNSPYMWVESNCTKGMKVSIRHEMVFAKVYNYITSGVIISENDMPNVTQEDGYCDSDLVYSIMIEHCSELRFIPIHLTPNNMLQGILKGIGGTLTISVPKTDELLIALTDAGRLF